jgi:TolB-like protein
MLTERSLPRGKEASPIDSLRGEKGLSLPTNNTFENDKKMSADPHKRSHRLCVTDSRRHQGVGQERAEGATDKGKNDAAIAPDCRTCLPPSASAVRQQLAKILQSKIFIQSEKLSRFLLFVVEHVIEGNPVCLKEYLVGVEVYDRKPPYDPSQDSIVRTEARRLRNKLKEYYGAEGKDDPVYIYLRPGTYVPALHSKEDLIGASNPAGTESFGLRNSSSIVAAIMPFRDMSGNPVSAAYARAIPDELAYALMLTDGCTVVSQSSVACPDAAVVDVAATMKKVGAQIAFEGSTRTDGANLRVTARIIDTSGAQLWIVRIDTEVGTQASFAIEEQIAKALSVGFDVVRAKEPTRPNENCSQRINLLHG